MHPQAAIEYRAGSVCKLDHLHESPPTGRRKLIRHQHDFAVGHRLGNCLSRSLAKTDRTDTNTTGHDPVLPLWQSWLRLCQPA